MMKKRVVSIMMTAAVLTGLLAGCGGGSGNGTQAADADSGDRTEASAAQDGSKGQEIVVWTQMMDNEAALLQEYANKWASETGIQCP